MAALSPEFLVYPWRHWTAGGVLLIPIACVCFGTWVYYLGLRRLLTAALRESRMLERRIADAPGGERIDALAAGDGVSAVFGPALARIVASVRDGISPAFAFEREEHVELSRLQRNVIVLAALTAVAPLLGLLGTVMGMVETFAAVSLSGAETTGRVASGISKALITTQFGLTVAIPGVFGLARVRRLLHHVRAQFSIIRVEALPALERLLQGEHGAARVSEVS